MHPTHRKVRDGWGTRASVEAQRKNYNPQLQLQGQRRQQIPFGDDNKKGKSNSKSKRRSRFFRYVAE